MKTLIKNGTILTAGNEYARDILIDGEKIAAIGKDLSKIINTEKDVDEIIDATDKYVMPG